MSLNFDDLFPRDSLAGRMSPLPHILEDSLPMGTPLDFADDSEVPFGADFLSPVLQHLDGQEACFDFNAASLEMEKEKGKKKVEFEMDPSESPASFLDEEDLEPSEEPPNLKWELELEQILQEFDSGIPIDPKVKEDLIHLSAKDFNRRTKTMHLDNRVVQFLKLERKRVKNRLAAIRSRNRKETRVVELEKQLEELHQVNSSQKAQISLLQQRLQHMEALVKAGNKPE